MTELYYKAVKRIIELFADKKSQKATQLNLTDLRRNLTSGNRILHIELISLNCKYLRNFSFCFQFQPFGSPHKDGDRRDETRRQRRQGQEGRVTWVAWVTRVSWVTWVSRTCRWFVCPSQVLFTHKLGKHNAASEVRGKAYHAHRDRKR